MIMLLAGLQSMSREILKAAKVDGATPWQGFWQITLIPFVDFKPDWKGWRSLGLSPDSLFETSTVREEFMKRFMNSVICSAGASLLAIIIGSLAAYGLTRFRCKFLWMRNEDISFFFLSQLIRRQWF